MFSSCCSLLLGPESDIVLPINASYPSQDPQRTPSKKLDPLWRSWSGAYKAEAAIKMRLEEGFRNVTPVFLSSVSSQQPFLCSSHLGRLLLERIPEAGQQTSTRMHV